ncbi:DUF6624 domain-containing protein [Brevundimonas naejangsanensis]|uniref:DUF6624 domain-containing protein n=1 Tax=Brevundimonas naejangsanensis TaxID=588932 RepID=UPI000EC2DF59|nr:DUF6624 domain-containing protein [Brevundimonas naejangsanensis]HAC00969.1 hypothetical protein [Brevundimonas sp.]
MITWIATLFLLGQAETSSLSDELSAEARALIGPVLETITEEKRRQAEAPPPQDDQERFLRMYRLDQMGREAMLKIDLSTLSPEQEQAANRAMWQAQNDADEANLDALLAMLPPEGWFLKSRYGEGPSQTAFLIIQHSNLEQWRRFVPVLEPLVAAGEVDGTQFGLMYDRLAVNEGRPQRYGTQVTCKNGRWVIDYDNLEDPANADHRRAEAGFPHTLAQYEARFASWPACREN